jgi:antitoxin component of MazEF toxin-antitoxin module
MALMKIRRQGRSLAVTLNAETLREAHLKEGDLVRPTVENGRVVLDPVTVMPGVRPHVLEIGRRIIQEERRLLQRLAEYDPKKP